MGDKLKEAVQQLVTLGDTGKIFMTCESHPSGPYRVILKSPTLLDAQTVYTALINIVQICKENGNENPHQKLD